MKILAVDSSSNSASVAVVSDKRLLGEFYINSQLKHSETLMPMIDSLLKNTYLEMNDIYISTQSACAKGDYSEAVYEITKDMKRAETSVRISLSHHTNKNDIENFEVQTIYFGGGTPSVIGAERILKILSFIILMQYWFW